MRKPAIALLLSLLSLVAGAQPSTSMTPRVRFETAFGDFTVELDSVRAPLTAENFLQYVREKAYDGTIFHRVIPNFVVQGGGYDAGLAPRQARATIANESGSGLTNRRGTIGLAREDSPHSGSSQFYFNLVDNPGLDPLPSRWGYAVFGQVVEGMEVIDRIAHLPTGNVDGFGPDVPVDRPLLRRAYVLEAAPAATVPQAPPPPAADPETPPASAGAGETR
ncbi:MAG: peptidylprolyl isomerase [Steroidobacteraceae bacterium]